MDAARRDIAAGFIWLEIDATGTAIYAYPFSDRSLYRSTDSGQSWNRIDSPLSGPVSAVSASPDVPGLLYAGTQAALYRSEDSGSTWRAVGAFHGVTIGAGSNPVIWGSSLGQNGRTSILRSVDGGASYADVFGGPAGLFVTSRTSTAYIRYDTRDVYKSSDDGDHWNKVASLVGPVAVRADNPDAIWVAYDDLSVWAIDTSATPSSRRTGTLAEGCSEFHAPWPDVLICNFSVSGDGGTHWRYFPGGPPGTAPYSMAFDRAHPGVAFVSTTAGLYRIDEFLP